MFGSVVVRPSEAGLPREFTHRLVEEKAAEAGHALGERMWECLAGRELYVATAMSLCWGATAPASSTHGWLAQPASREGRSRRFSALPDRRGGQLAGRTWWRFQSAWSPLATFWL